jgi:hypothetical protein
VSGFNLNPNSEFVDLRVNKAEDICKLSDEEKAEATAE